MTAPEPQQTVLGLLAAPGLAEDIAAELARELPPLLGRRFPEHSWSIVVRTDARASLAGLDVDLVRLTREQMLAEDWDLAICLTDVPLDVGRRPVSAYATAALGVGVVSVPALGAVDLEPRVRVTVLRLLERMLGGGTGSREIQVRAGAVRGNLRLVAGMVRANRPWQLTIRLSRALAAALGGAAFSIVSPGVWKVAAGAGPLRLLGLTVGSVLATCATLIIAHRLWEPSPSREARQRVALVNLAVLLTCIIGVLTLYLALLVINAVCGTALIPTDVFAGELTHPVGLDEYLRLAWLVSSLATIGGALGAVVESNLAVREAVFGYRADDTDDEDG